MCNKKSGKSKLYTNPTTNIEWLSFTPYRRNLKDISRFIRRCDDCQRYKHSKQHTEPLTITTASYAFEKNSLDIAGPLNQVDDDNRCILTLQCDLTKFVEAYPIKNKEAETVARTFLNNFILRFGIPKEIVTDQSTEFLAKIFKESAKILGIGQLSSTAYHRKFRFLLTYPNSQISRHLVIIGTFLVLYI